MSDPFTQLSAEEKLLLSLCRLNFSEEQKSEIRNLMEEVKDWDHFVELANIHGIIALTWNNLLSIGNSDKIPFANFSKLHYGYLASLTRNTYLFQKLSEILNLIKDDELKIVLLKGLALEKTVYDDKGLRQMNDMDILVPRDKVIRLRKILMNNGFRSLPVKSPLYEYIILDIGKHVPALIKDDCSVEIHHNLFGTNAMFLTQILIKQSVPVSINGKEAFVPSSQLLFLYLIAHLEYHDFTGGTQLRQYADLVLLLDAFFSEIINENLINYAVEAGLETQLAGKLYLLNTFWNISYPDWLTGFISKYDNSHQLDKFSLFLRHPKDNQIEDISSNYSNQIRSIPGIFKKTIYIMGFIFPSLEFMKNRYFLRSKTMALFYYPVRWIRTAGSLVKGKNVTKRLRE